MVGMLRRLGHLPAGTAVTGVLIALLAALAIGCGESGRAPTGAGPLPGGPPPPGGGVAIAAITPDTLVVGATATITGAGFSPTPSVDTVRIDGAMARVTAATPTQLTVVVPATLPCGAAHAAAIVTRVAADSAIIAHPLRTAIARPLAVGTSLVITDASQLACNELPAAGARYVVSVYSTALTTDLGAPFTVTGTTATGTSAVIARRAAPPDRSGDATDAIDASAAPALAHARILARNLAFIDAHRGEFFGAAAGRARALHHARALHRARASNRIERTASVAPLAAAALPTVGSLRTLHVPLPQGCSAPTTISARVVAVSARAVIYEDTAWPFAGELDQVYPQLGQAFDTQMYPSDSANFGDPLLTDALTDDDGHIAIVFTPLLNQIAASGLTGPCDFLPPNASTNRASNFGEYLYAVLPDTFGGPEDARGWLATIEPVVVHETKHLASDEWRIVHHAPTEQLWLEESLARHAEEVWARTAVYHVPWKGNTGYAASVFCDEHLSDARCDFRPVGMGKHFRDLYTYLDSTATHSPFGSVRPSDASFYNSGWSLVRWAIDRYAGDETTALRALTQSQSLTGMANIAAVVGHSPEEILGNWSLAMILDDDPAMAADADVRFPTWNIYDIMRGLEHDFPNDPALRVPPPVTTPVNGDFTVASPGLFGGAFQALRIATTAASPTVVIALHGGTSGSPAPPSLRLAIARVQ